MQRKDEEGKIIKINYKYRMKGFVFMLFKLLELINEGDEIFRFQKREEV